MKLKSIENGTYRILIAAAIVLAIGCMLLRFQMHRADNYLFMQLVSAISDHRNADGLKSELWDSILLCIECAGAVLIGCKLAAVPRSIALVQLYIVSMIAQVLLYSSASVAGHPFSSAITVCLGGALGYVFRRQRLKDEKFASQYYELNLRNKELQEARLLLVKQDEVERRMLAADLHDQVLNDLKALKQSIDKLETGVSREQAGLDHVGQDAAGRDQARQDAAVLGPGRAQAAETRELLERAIANVREVMDSLCPSTLEHLGLPAAIEDCCRRGAQRAGFKIRFINELDEAALDGLSVVEKSLLYRLAQESITNICKHAGATRVRANLSLENNNLLISIGDDGKGMDSSSPSENSRGLRYMRLRADLIGATVSWRAGEENKGTIVEIRKEISERNGDAHPDS
jgi:signal transduction histidine kinase